MKTAHEILRNSNPFSVEVKEYEAEYVISFNDAVNAMHEYGLQCAEKALKDAAKNINSVKEWDSLEYYILSIPIVTP